MAGPQEACVAARVHVQEIARTGPLVAVRGLLDQPRPPRDPGSPQHLPDGRVREPGRAGDEARTPAGLSATVADPLLQLGGQQARRAVRTARAINERLGPTLAVKPTVPPAMRRRRGDAEGGRGRLQRKTVLNRAHQRETTSQSELGVSVQKHPRPPLSVSPGRPTASKEGRIEPQPFTTSVGSTASYSRCWSRSRGTCSTSPC